MSIFKKLFKPAEAKAVVTSGFDLLAKLTGTEWTRTNLLKSYEKSLYVFACVSKIAEKVAATDFQMFQIINSAGDTKEIMNHPALDLLYRVNPFQTKAELFQITVINLKLCGDAFWFKVKNGKKVIELWNLRPDNMTIVNDAGSFIKHYEYTKQDGTKVIFLPEEIVHFKKPTPLSEYYGITPVTPARNRIETEDLASSFQRDFFLNSARPDAVLKYSGILRADEKEELRDYFETRHKGRGNTSKVALLQGGMEYQQISISQREMDFIESMKFTRDDILVAFQVPKPIVAITDDVNLANAKTAKEIFLSETIWPEVQAMMEKINEELVIPDFGEQFFIDAIDPTPANREQILSEYNSGLDRGWLLINEVRARENLPPIAGGDTLYKPFNLVPVGEYEAPTTPEEFTEEADKMKAQKRLKIFRGRPMLQMKLQLMEAVEKEAKAKAKNHIVGSSKKVSTKTRVPLIPAEKRMDYYELVNKKIDSKAIGFKAEVDRMAANQWERFMNFMQSLPLTKGVEKMPLAARKAIGEFYAKEGKVWADFGFPFIEQYFREAGIDAMQMVAPEGNFEITPAVMKQLKARAKEFSLGVNQTTRDKVTRVIQNGLKDGDGIQAITEKVGASVYGEFEPWRSQLIARTETTGANNAGAIEGYKQSGVVVGTEWIATQDSRTRDSHAEQDGDVVELGGTFENGCRFPGDPQAEPDEVCNCRCAIGPVIEK